MSDGTKLPKLAAAAEKFTDEYVAALDVESEAFAAERRAYHTAYAVCDEKASEARKVAVSEHASVEEKIALHHAGNNVAAMKAKRDSALAILSAAQSHLRAVERQT